MWWHFYSHKQNEIKSLYLDLTWFSYRKYLFTAQPTCHMYMRNTVHRPCHLRESIFLTILLIVTEFCTMCSPGTYQDEVGQSSCKNCPGGYYSSSSKDRCNPCEAGTYAATDGTGCKSCGSTTQCPCMGSTTLCYHPDLCYNMDGSYGCLPCPTGYAGNGVTCSDVDEVKVAFVELIVC